MGKPKLRKLFLVPDSKAEKEIEMSHYSHDVKNKNASFFDPNVQRFEMKNWRKYFSNKLSGKGLEIGPLHRPMCKHDSMQVDYIDRYTVKELRAEYPELKELDLIEPDIIGDAEDLSVIKDQAYDFLISAHVIEHMKNPLQALKNWMRIIKPGGLIYLIAPDKRAIFDHPRSRTQLAHMILDYKEPSKLRDYEHYLDYAAHVHDKRGESTIEEANRLIETDYSIHYHVFTPADMLELLNWFSENVKKIEIVEGPVLSPQINRSTENTFFSAKELDCNNPNKVEVFAESDEFHFLIKVL